MRHGASLLASLEGMSRLAYQIAEELSDKSRSGLTVRFLAKKLEIPDEEVEYLVDVYDRLFYADISRIKLAPDGQHVIKRIAESLSSQGDFNAFANRIRSMSQSEFGLFMARFSHHMSMNRTDFANWFVNRYYDTPSNIRNCLQDLNVSKTAHEVFDLLWESPKGIMPAGQLRALHGGSDAEVEQAIWELVQHCVLYEMFRFDNEGRLVRVVALLAEIRQYRESMSKAAPMPMLETLDAPESEGSDLGIQLSESIGYIVIALVGGAARMRKSGGLYKEDQKRVEDLVPPGEYLNVDACIWIAEVNDWLDVSKDNLVVAGQCLDALISMSRFERHIALDDLLQHVRDYAIAKNTLQVINADLDNTTWYLMEDLVEYAARSAARDEDGILQQMDNGVLCYANPSNTEVVRDCLTRTLQCEMHWLGLVAHLRRGNQLYIRFTTMGIAFLRGDFPKELYAQFPDKGCEFVVQPNFEVVVPSDQIDPLKMLPLERFAERSGSDQARIYTLTKARFTQAMQSGHDPKEFVVFLLKHNRMDELPPNVVMTLEDWMGGMKRVKIRTLHIVESEDPLVIAEIAHQRRYNQYIQHIDPNSMLNYKGISKAKLAKLLEKDGYLID